MSTTIRVVTSAFGRTTNLGALTADISQSGVRSTSGERITVVRADGTSTAISSYTVETSAVSEVVSASSVQEDITSSVKTSSLDEISAATSTLDSTQTEKSTAAQVATSTTVQEYETSTTKTSSLEKTSTATSNLDSTQAEKSTVSQVATSITLQETETFRATFSASLETSAAKSTLNSTQTIESTVARVGASLITEDDTTVGDNLTGKSYTAQGIPYASLTESSTTFNGGVVEEFPNSVKAVSYSSSLDSSESSVRNSSLRVNDENTTEESSADSFYSNAVSSSIDSIELGSPLAYISLDTTADNFFTRFEQAEATNLPAINSDTELTRTVAEPVVDESTVGARQASDAKTTTRTAKSLPTEIPQAPISAIRSGLIFLPTLQKKYALLPLLFLGFSLGESCSVFSLLSNIYSHSRLRNVHYTGAVLTFCLLLVNQAITGLLIDYQLFPYDTSDQFMAAMAMAGSSITGLILLLIYFEFLQTLSILYKVLNVDVARHCAYKSRLEHAVYCHGLLSLRGFIGSIAFLAVCIWGYRGNGMGRQPLLFATSILLWNIVHVRLYDMSASARNVFESCRQGARYHWSGVILLDHGRVFRTQGSFNHSVQNICILCTYSNAFR